MKRVNYFLIFVALVFSIYGCEAKSAIKIPISRQFGDLMLGMSGGEYSQLPMWHKDDVLGNSIKKEGDSFIHAYKSWDDSAKIYNHLELKNVELVDIEFHNNILYKISIYWNSNVYWNDFLQKATDKYGNGKFEDDHGYIWSDGKTDLQLMHLYPNVGCVAIYKDILVANMYYHNEEKRRKESSPSL